MVFNAIITPLQWDSISKYHPSGRCIFHFIPTLGMALSTVSNGWVRVCKNGEFVIPLPVDLNGPSVRQGIAWGPLTAWSDTAGPAVVSGLASVIRGLVNAAVKEGVEGVRNVLRKREVFSSCAVVLLISVAVRAEYLDGMREKRDISRSSSQSGFTWSEW